MKIAAILIGASDHATMAPNITRSVCINNVPFLSFGQRRLRGPNIHILVELNVRCGIFIHYSYFACSFGLNAIFLKAYTLDRKTQAQHDLDYHSWDEYNTVILVDQFAFRVNWEYGNPQRIVLRHCPNLGRINSPRNSPDIG